MHHFLSILPPLPPKITTTGLRILKGDFSHCTFPLQYLVKVNYRPRFIKPLDLDNHTQKSEVA